MSNYQETRLAFRAERLKEGMTKNQAARAWESSPECYKLGENLREKEWNKGYSDTPVVSDNYSYSTIPCFEDLIEDYD